MVLTSPSAPVVGNALILGDDNFVTVVDNNGEHKFQFGQGQLDTPNGIAIDNQGQVYVTDDSHGFQIFSPTGEWIRGTVREGLSYPIGIAVNDFGTVVVSEFHGKVQLFEPGSPKPTKTLIPGDSDFKEPWGVTMDAEGKILVVDEGSGKIEIFSPEGDYLRHIDCGILGAIKSVTIDRDGNLLIPDKENDKILVYGERNKPPS